MPARPRVLFIVLASVLLTVPGTVAAERAGTQPTPDRNVLYAHCDTSDEFHYWFSNARDEPDQDTDGPGYNTLGVALGAGWTIPLEPGMEHPVELSPNGTVDVTAFLGSQAGGRVVVSTTLVADGEVVAEGESREVVMTSLFASGWQEVEWTLEPQAATVPEGNLTWEITVEEAAASDYFLGMGDGFWSRIEMPIAAVDNGTTPADDGGEPASGPGRATPGPTAAAALLAVAAALVWTRSRRRR